MEMIHWSLFHESSFLDGSNSYPSTYMWLINAATYNLGSIA